jgi:hypothetical protein
MKNVVLMVFTGIALFLGAMVGLLAAQGRLTYDGTRNIPILSSLFKKPAGDADEGAKDKKDAGDNEGHDGSDKTGAKILPYKKGSSTPDKVDSGGMADPNALGDGQSIIREPEQPRKRDDGKKPTQQEQEWEMQRNQLDNQQPYPRGLFDFKKVKADINLQEFNAMVRAVKKKQREQEEMDAALEKKRRDLETQMADVLYRQQEVAKQMQQVVQERDRLNRRIEEFHKKVLLVKQDEVAGLKENARNIANLDPETGRDLILSWWNQGAAGEARAIKTLSLMSRESVEAILEVMQTDRIREILDKRLTLARTKTEGDTK